MIVIVISHPRAYFLCNWRAVTCVCPITAIQLQPFVLDSRNWRPTLRARQSVVFGCFPPTFKLIENNLDALSTSVRLDFLISSFVNVAIN